MNNWQQDNNNLGVGINNVHNQNNFHSNNSDSQNRKNMLLTEFNQLKQESNNNRDAFTQEEILEYLDKLGSRIYDKQLAAQIFQGCYPEDNGNKIKLEDFINVFIETEDTILFRIQLEESKRQEYINQLKQLQQEQKQKNTQQDQQQNNTLLVQVMEATKLEPISPEYSLDPFVKIQCGDEVQSTRVIYNNDNPKWNEDFKFNITPNIKEIIFILTDKERALKNEEIGFLKISLEELKDQHIKDKNEHVIKRESQLRIRTKLHIKIQHKHQDNILIQEQIKQLEDDIYYSGYQIKQNQDVLDILKNPFKSLQNKKNTFYDITNNNTNTVIPLKPINNNYQNYSEIGSNIPEVTDQGQLGQLRIRKFEESLLNQIESQVKNQVSDWSRPFIGLFIFYGILSLLTCFYRSNFVDFTTFALYSGIIRNGQLIQKHMRLLVFILLCSLLVFDTIWAIIYFGNWTEENDYSVPQENKIKIFVEGISVLLIIIKIPFTIVTWRNSIYYPQFNDAIQRYIKPSN